MIKTVLITLSSLFVFQACVDYQDDPLCSEYEYLTFEKLRKSVIVQDPKEIEERGKITIYEDLLFINEPNQGVHIIDNHNKENPIAKAFIKIPGNIDTAVKDGYLYVDSFMDLVIIDIRDINKIKEIQRKKDLFVYDEFIDYDIIDECGYDIDSGVIIKAKK
ncbi:MAG: hypothetical protein U9P38_04790 [Campylobacterota bacterium]|nr:hypothetical protein [Campylobacterota bacterium]